MNIPPIIKIIAASLTILTGIYFLMKAKKIKSFTGLEANTPVALTEIRTVMGGTLIGLGVAALIFPIPQVYKTLAVTYAVIAGIRAISMVVEKSIEKSNLIILASEVVLAFILYYPV